MSKILTNFQKYWPIFKNIGQSSKILTNLQKYWPIFKNIDQSSKTLTNLQKYWPISFYTKWNESYKFAIMWQRKCSWQKLLCYINVYYKFPQNFSKIRRTILTNLALFWYIVIPTIYPPFSFFLKHFSQTWLF